MKRTTYLSVLLASGVLLTSVQASAQSPSAAPQAPAPVKAGITPTVLPMPDFITGGFSIGTQVASDVASSKFQEYRDIPTGPTLPAFRLFGSRNDVQYDVNGSNVSLNDQRYSGYLKAGPVAIRGGYNAIVHNLWNGGRTLLDEQSPGVWRISPTLQQAFQNTIESTPTASRNFITFVTPLLAPSLAEGAVVDVGVQRQRGNVAIEFGRNQPLTAKVSYTREQRHGNGALSGNNISYVVETPAPTEYLTQDYLFDAAVNQEWGNVRGAFQYNTFNNQVEALRFDNPLVAVDRLAGTVTLPGGAASVGGASNGLVPLPPDNSAYTGSFGATFKLQAHTRIFADVSIGNMKQNAQLFPFATSRAIVSPLVASSTASLPVQSINGKIATTSVVFGLSSRPAPPLQLNVRYRSYDANNKTPRVEIEHGYSTRDYDWAAEERITAPYSNKNARFDASAGYTAGMVTLEGGFRQTKIDRTFRETAQTTENAGSFAAVVHASDAADVRLVFEKASRDYSGLLPQALRNEQTHLEQPTVAPPNVLQRDGNLRYDQSQKDSNRVGLNLDIEAGAGTTFSLQYLRNYDTYSNTVHGLQDDKYNTFTGEVSVAPVAQWNLFVYYSYEKGANNMVSSGNSPFLPVNDYNMLWEDKANTVGFGTMFQLVPDKVTVNLSSQYQKVDGNIHFDVNPASTNALGRVAYGGVKDPTNVDDTKITRVDGSLDYALADAWSITGGAWYENYTISDYMTTGLLNLYPSAFFLAGNDGSYKATVGYLRLNYRW